MTPLQLFMLSPTSVDHVIANASTHGVEEEGPVPDTECPDNCVVVDSPVYALSPALQARLLDPFSNDGNYGINLYLQVLTILQNQN